MAKILIIENSEDVREMLIEVLNTYGHEVLGISDKSNPISNISSFKPHLVLLDASFGYKYRREICQQIKTAYPNLPICLMATDPKLLGNYEFCEANDFIEKPFDITQLKNKIDRVLSEATTYKREKI